jgi:hypothetical protein
MTALSSDGPFEETFYGQNQWQHSTGNLHEVVRDHAVHDVVQTFVPRMSASCMRYLLPALARTRQDEIQTALYLGVKDV